MNPENRVAPIKIGDGGGPSPRSQKRFKKMNSTCEHETPLHIAVKKGCLQTTTFLINRGINPNRVFFNNK